MSQQYTRGRNTEYKIVNEFKNEGFMSVRSSGSHSLVDVFAWNGEHVYFIQSKRTKKKTISAATKRELKKFKEMPCPDFVRREFRVWIDREGFTILWKSYE